MFTTFHQSWFNYGILFGILSVVIFFRYLLTAVLYDFFVLSFFQKKRSNRLLQSKQLPARQRQFEIIRSALSSIIFAAFAIGLFYLFLNGYTAIYLQWSDYPLWYHPLSIAVFLLAQDTYYYWLHRWFHRPRVFRYFHRWHHDSIQTNSLTSFSFNPSESALQSAFFPIFLLFVPIHIYSFLIVLLFMTISATINHGAVEVYPKGRGFDWVQHWIIGATHHDLHHKKFNYNYGLYFTFWDRWMGTEYKDPQK